MDKLRTETIAHIQETVNLLADMASWQESAFLHAMSHGLQGDKRENRYESTIDDINRKYLMSEAMGMFGVEVEPHSTTMKFPKTNEPLDFLKEYYAGLCDIYHKIHLAANTFVSPLCMRDLAQPLYDRASCIRKIITMLKRDIDRYEAVKVHGTPLHDLYRVNNTAETKHDLVEPKENSIGYPG